MDRHTARPIKPVVATDKHLPIGEHFDNVTFKVWGNQPVLPPKLLRPSFRFRRRTPTWDVGIFNWVGSDADILKFKFGHLLYPTEHLPDGEILDEEEVRDGGIGDADCGCRIADELPRAHQVHLACLDDGCFFRCLGDDGGRRGEFQEFPGSTGWVPVCMRIDDSDGYRSCKVGAENSLEFTLCGESDTFDTAYSGWPWEGDVGGLVGEGVCGSHFGLSNLGLGEEMG